ncbi:SAM-dependent methyltransferase [Actinosynnema sp. NPDC050436]|uniref:SAM-dependent methyltransferase n=1 Tax=Actinosynnema sp. NPDC050436 TaxID=3155659 RepID=UPI0033CA17E2
MAVAAARAVESSRPDRLVEDPFAEAFVRAAPTPRPLPTRWPDDLAALTDQQVLLLLGANYVGLRTRFFDDALADPGRQVVLLAAGLDTRAFRLAWPAGTTAYELDQPEVPAFKDSVLTAPPRCTRVPVPVDLAGDWATPLRAAGFDPGTPTAWLAEGLLHYLDADAERALVDTVDRLSAPGSTLTVERAMTVPDRQALEDGSDRLGVRMDEIVHTGPRTDLTTTLRDRGWTAEDIPADTVATRYGRPLPHPDLVRARAGGAAQPTQAGFTRAEKTG